MRIASVLATIITLAVAVPAAKEPDYRSVKTAAGSEVSLLGDLNEISVSKASDPSAESSAAAVCGGFSTAQCAAVCANYGFQCFRCTSYSCQCANGVC